MKYLATWVLVMLLEAVAFGCGNDDSGGGDTDTNTDSDTDTDTDSDTDTDTDSDTDTDTDSDTDTDTDSDTDSDTEGGCGGTPIVSQTEADANVGSTNPLIRYGQTFIPWADYITDLELWLKDRDWDVGPVTIELYADVGGSPDTEALVSVQIDVAVTKLVEPYCVSFEPVSVISDETYWIVLQPANDVDQSGVTGWSYGVDNPYPDGEPYSYDFKKEIWWSFYELFAFNPDFTFSVYGGTGDPDTDTDTDSDT